MTTLINEHLCERAAGAALLHVSSLADWLKAKKLQGNFMEAISSHEYIQLELLLCHIGNMAIAGLSLEQASSIVCHDKALRARFLGQAASEKLKATLSSKLALFEAGQEDVLMGSSSVIGGAAVRQWETIISDAVGCGELVLLDFTSKLPIRQEFGVVAKVDSGSPPRVAWRMVLNANISKIDAAYRGKASVVEAIKWLRTNGGDRILDEGNSDVLMWLDDNKTKQTVAKKTVSTALSAARKPS